MCIKNKMYIYNVDKSYNIYVHACMHVELLPRFQQKI